MIHISFACEKEVASRQAKPPFVIHQTGQKKDLLFSIPNTNQEEGLVW
jgi:hypothetical protein